MRRIVLTLAATAVALPVFAQSLPVRSGAAEPAEPTVGLFISPAGEPFRAREGQPYPLSDWFNRADADHNGALNFTEFDQDALGFFDVVDGNKDGRINGVENQAYENTIAPEILRDTPTTGRRTTGPGGRKVRSLSPRRTGPVQLRPPRKGAGFYALLNEPQPVSGADGDFNTIITREEWSAAARRRFGRLDVNADRALKLDELPVPPIVRWTAGEDPNG